MSRRLAHCLPAALVAVSLVAVPLRLPQGPREAPRNVRVVQDGVLYRSGQPSPLGLGGLVHDYDIRTVVCFRDVEEGKALGPARPVGGGLLC